MNTTTVTVRLKNVTGSEANEWRLWELHREGYKMGKIYEGIYKKTTGAVYLDRGIAYVGETCEIVTTLERRMDAPQLPEASQLRLFD